jgi:DNA-binding NtrC family response regulator
MKQVSILLVSGEKEDYELFHEMLSQAKHASFTVDWVNAFEAGILALEMKRYAIALVEDDLGILKGSQFIQKAEQNGVQIPFILFTCSECWERDEEAFKSDAVYCLSREKITAERLEDLILKELDWQLKNLFLQF